MYRYLDFISFVLVSLFDDLFAGLAEPTLTVLIVDDGLIEVESEITVGTFAVLPNRATRIL